MNIKDTILRFSKSFGFPIRKQTHVISEEQMDLFILQSFNELSKKDKESSENYDETLFIQKFDSELKEKLKLDITAVLGRKITDNEATLQGKQIAQMLLNEFNRINKEISVEKFDILRKEVIDSGNDIDAKLKFYYDETNNPRKFWIKQNKFNAPVNKNFVLGGVVFDENEFIGDPDDLIAKLKLPKNVIDIKSQLILESTFVDSLKSKELNLILKWIFENGIYIHFINVDNLHIIVNDILQIIIDKNLDSEKVRGLELMHGHTLYKLMSSNIDQIRELLAKYDYPKIQKEAVIDFCEDWATLLKHLKSNLPSPKDKIEEMSRAVIYDGLWNLFDEMKKDNHFIGLGKNKYIVKDYSDYYLIKPELFLNSFHTFDNETEVEKVIYASADLDSEENRNFVFKKSHEEKFIQISDVVVGVLSRFFKYIEELSIEMENGKMVPKLIHSVLEFDDSQKENFLLLVNVLKKSQDKNKLFFYSENTFVQKNNLDFILSVIDITDEVVNFTFADSHGNKLR
ncbi:DUF3800 domain-containing protein [Cohnella soli]|uniref:DUF3800 domain-containing protein n=1 Tax=Cohnella soli TaxID=425005 RepID=A0ABW0HX16_9BACL